MAVSHESILFRFNHYFIYYAYLIHISTNYNIVNNKLDLAVFKARYPQSKMSDLLSIFT